MERRYGKHHVEPDHDTSREDAEDSMSFEEGNPPSDFIAESSINSGLLDLGSDEVGDGLSNDGGKSIGYGDFDEVSYYLQEIGKTPLLTDEEEIKLAKQIKRGDYARKRLEDEFVYYLSEETHGKFEKAAVQGMEAKDHMVRANLRLVISIAKKYRGRGVDFLDLIQEGNQGLMKAVDKFDHTMGNKFSTYATWWIRQGITRAILSQGRTIRLPVHIGGRLGTIREAARKLEQENGEYPTTEEIASYLKLSPIVVRTTIQDGREPVSLEEPTGEGDDEGDGSLIDFIPGSRDEAGEVIDNIQREDMRAVLAAARLTDREREVIELRYGLRDGEFRTLEEVGEMFKVTRERIRQIEAIALRKLRHPSSGLGRFRP